MGGGGCARETPARHNSRVRVECGTRCLRFSIIETLASIIGKDALAPKSDTVCGPWAPRVGSSPLTETFRHETMGYIHR